MIFGHRPFITSYEFLAVAGRGKLSVGVQTDDDVYYGLKSAKGSKYLLPLAVSWYINLR
jgi:hypothetical protein